MSDGTAPAGDGAVPAGRDGRVDPAEWRRIERSPEFRELTSRRHRFIAIAAAVTFAEFALYLGLATYATGFMGTLVGGVPIAWLAAMCQVFMTWAVTWLYLRQADRVFTPLEERVAETAGARFMREASTGADATTTERSAR
jgi:uncharacterized membrane protein (DUF485 family)